MHYSKTNLRLLISRAIVLILAMILFVATGCAKRMSADMVALQNKPAWVSGESLNYPEHLYLLGHGVSAELEKAKQDAWNDLFKRLQKEIIKKREGSEAFNQASLSRILNQESLSKSRLIADTWEDPFSNAHHVLAIIDRIAAGKIISDEIYLLENQIKRTLDKADTEKDVLQRIAYARLSIDKFEKREKLANVLKIVKPTAVLRKMEWDLSKLQKYIDSFVASTKIKPVTDENSSDHHLLDALVSGIKQAGFNVEHGAQADYILKATVESKAITWKDGVFTMHGKIKLELRDGQQQNQVRGRTSWPVEVSALEREALPEKLADAVTKINGDKLKQAFIDFQLN